MTNLHGLQVLVLGLGDSGLAMARWCARFGARVRVWDSRSDAPQAAALALHLPAAQFMSGALTDAAFADVALVLKSPGLAPSDERIAAPLLRAVQRGVAVQGELSLFARALADLRIERGYAPKVIAITGTNGKTTTTSMAAQLVERAGLRAVVAGNIGPTMLQTLADAFDLEGDVAAPRPHPGPLPEGEGAMHEALHEAHFERLPLPLGEGGGEGSGDVEPLTSPADAIPDPIPDPTTESDQPQSSGPPPHLIPPPPPGPVFAHLPEVWVLELSSFQLDAAEGFEPTAATVLNLSEDHLDWHGSMAAYAAAKAQVFGHRAVMVLNRDDALVEQLAAGLQPVAAAVHTDAKTVGRTAGRGKVTPPPQRDIVRFGLGAPQQPGDWGLVSEHGIAWLARAMPADETRVRVKRGSGNKAVAEVEDLVIQRLLPADALRVRGRHNAANALAALALAEACGCPVAPMLHALRDYAGEPHRVQQVASIGGVDAIDDSKGTNVGATVAALTGLGEDRNAGRATGASAAKLVVILGGEGKGQDFTPLAAPVQRHVRAVATLGRDADRIEAALAPTGVPLQRHATLPAATRWAFAQALPGDAVLLSPACASFDMFRNYSHRAEVFVAEVLALAADAGEVAV